MEEEEDRGSPLTNPFVLAAGAVGLIGAGVLAILSLGAVPPLEYGLRYNNFNQFVDVDTLYTAGRHFIGPWNSFLLFPATIQGVEFYEEDRIHRMGIRYPSLHTRTKEGLALHLEVALQYRLVPEKIGSLYAEFNMKYEDFFISQIRDTLIRAAADYEAAQLWVDRPQVGERMLHMVNETLQQTYAECWGLQLMSIELPETFDAAIVKTQVVSQNVSTMQFAQLATQIRAQTQVIQSEYDRRVKVILAGGKANYTVTTKTARATARRNVLQTESQVLQNVKDKLRIDEAELVQYQEFMAIAMLPNATVFFGFDNTSEVLLRQRAPEERPGSGPSVPSPQHPRSLHDALGAESSVLAPRGFDDPVMRRLMGSGSEL